MERMYRCTSCGLRSRVVGGPAAASIHCPRCGGEAVYRPGWSDAPGGPVVQIDLSEAVSIDTFADDDSLDPDGATERQDGPTRPAGEGRGPHAQQLEESDPAAHGRATRPVSFESERERAPGSEPTPVGSPPRALSSTPRDAARGLEDSVTAIPHLDVGTRDRGEPRYPILSEPVDDETGDVEHTTRRYAALDLGNEGVGEEGARGAPLAVSGVPWPGVGPRQPEHMGSDLGAWSPPPVPLSPGVPPPARLSASTSAAPEDIARGGRGLEGKAWSASGIQRALEREGFGNEEPTPLPKATPTRGLDALPSRPRTHIAAQEGGPSAPDRERNAQADTLRSVNEPDAPPHRAESTVPGPLRPPGRRRRRPKGAPAGPYHAATPLSGPGLRDRSANSRLLIILTLCAAVLAVGVVVGIVWYQQAGSVAEPEVDAFSHNSRSDEALARQRAGTYALERLDLAGPAEVAWRVESLTYPSTMRLALRVTNRSTEPIAGLHLTASWYVVHDVPTMARATVSSFAPPVTASAPLAPGEGVSAVVDFTLEDPPPGSARESFVWVSLTVANTALDIAFEGGAAMVEVAPGERGGSTSPVDP